MSVEHLWAPAKLTVSLEVTGRRPDGYHEIRAEMVSLDLCDELEVDGEGNGLEVVCDDAARARGLTSDDANLVRRALAVVGRTAHVRLHKRIPVGGGLGGGSTDAAAILRWAGETDHRVAAGLGADVPFCVAGGRAMVRGVGEEVEPLAFEHRTFVLVVPPFGVDTGAVYRTWDALADRRKGSIRNDRHAVNDLTDAALETEPRLIAWRDAIADLTGHVPTLAGSGSTWWLEGSSATLGLTRLRVGSDEGSIIDVRTVPAGWSPSITS